MTCHFASGTPDRLLSREQLDSEKVLLLVGNFLSRSAGTSRGVCEDLADRLAETGWSVIRTSEHQRRLARLTDMVTTTWKQRHLYTVAHVDIFSGPAFLWAEAVCSTLRRARKPYVVTLRGGSLPIFARRWPRRVHRLLKSAAVVTAPSRFLQEGMQPYRSDIRVIPNPVNLSACRFQSRKSTKPHLVWLRAFHEIYNPSLAPKVVKLLLADFPEVRLTMIGPDKGDGSLQHMRQIANDLGVSDRINVIGGVPKAEVPASLARGAIFLNTTNVDNTPVSVIEAMACGLCIVSTNVGGIPYLIEHEHDALLVPPDNPKAMAEAVRRILTDPELAAMLSRNGRALAEQSDWSVVLPQWDTLLSGLIQRKS